MPLLEAKEFPLLKLIPVIIRERLNDSILGAWNQAIYGARQFLLVHRTSHQYPTTTVPPSEISHKRPGPTDEEGQNEYRDDYFRVPNYCAMVDKPERYGSRSSPYHEESR